MLLRCTWTLKYVESWLSGRFKKGFGSLLYLLSVFTCGEKREQIRETGELLSLQVTPADIESREAEISALEQEATRVACNGFQKIGGC